ncbi:bifunctional UDP-sugar hydrolase/5'-nucleotidase [Psychrobacillus sp.]|uniref:bifunctional metallophosphatase/5'-nucleotidase n=1 Tax=Psychrobacillus sp. TaxID=1871623 RepID=UPI0028BD7155|nr:bifunctional UDP-sugar hydrolase/5'-nucleotidase [Psychrobacillus sp.]
MRETIHIYHTNDLHSHLENWPTIHQFLSNKRKTHKNNDPCLVMDIGDHLDRSNVFTEGTLGKGNVELLNKACYDYVTIGNNEGITLSHEDLHALYTDAKFDVIVSNFTDLHGDIPQWLLPYKIHETPSGVRIGIVAVTADFGIYYENLGWHIQHPINRLKEICEEIKDQVDILVCMSHLGMTLDDRMTEEIPQIDVILGAHTHHFFKEGKLFHQTLQAAAGKLGVYIGHVMIEYDHAANKVISKAATLYPIDELEKPSNDAEQIAQWEEIGKQRLAYTVFQNPVLLTKDWFHPSSMSYFFGEALVAFTAADCAMFPAGIFLTDLNKGPITAYDLHAVLPHPINPCIVSITGTELLEVIELSKNEKWPRLEVKGLGFRGKYLGAMQFHQLVVQEDGEVYVNGELLEVDKTYSLATLDMFTFGYFFPSFKWATKKYFMPEFIRDVVKWYGQQQELKK